MKGIIVLRKYEFKDVWERLCEMYGVNKEEEFIITYIEH